MLHLSLGDLVLTESRRKLCPRRRLGVVVDMMVAGIPVVLWAVGIDVVGGWAGWLGLIGEFVLRLT